MKNISSSVSEHQSLEAISSRVLSIRGQKVLIDADLATLYGVETKRLNEQVKRNLERFPQDFMFQLTANEKAEVVANCDHLSRLKFSKTLPFVFTEHGAIQAANVLSSKEAIEMGVYIVRAFVRLRELVLSHQDLTHKLSELEQHVEQKFQSHDQAIAGLINMVRELMNPTLPSNKHSIGFVTQKDKAK
ncbi:MAG TPA: ORF6N domain-containing protein [Methylotenera sp.]|nr:ORF6N domain-containing protein [Methylotenera sp.]HPN02243.1 ORF6N domain-containing protein [Methylotenera sp.]